MTRAEQPDRPRRGRPPGTSARELELIALRLFSDQGFDETTVEEIAAAAGVSRRTFFRYFDSKAAVLWDEFDGEVEELRAAFERVPDDVPLMDAIRQVVVGVNRYHAEDVPELRTRMNLITAVPALQASAAPHYDAWERAVSAFAARRLGQPPTRCTCSRSAGPRWPRAAPPTTGGSRGRTPTSPSTWTWCCARWARDSRRTAAIPTSWPRRGQSRRSGRRASTGRTGARVRAFTQPNHTPAP